MRKKKHTHGGKRHNSGRKPIEDKKVQIAIYIRESRIKELGGQEAFKKWLIETADPMIITSTITSTWMPALTIHPGSHNK